VKRRPSRRRQVGHPQQSGWLDEWGRLKGGRRLSLGAALKRAFVDGSALCAGSIREFLFADVLAGMVPLQSRP